MAKSTKSYEERMLATVKVVNKKNETDSEKAYEVYVPIQQEMSIRHDGSTKAVLKGIFPGCLQAIKPIFWKCLWKLMKVVI